MLAMPSLAIFTGDVCCFTACVSAFAACLLAAPAATADDKSGICSAFPPKRPGVPSPVPRRVPKPAYFTASFVSAPRALLRRKLVAKLAIGLPPPPSIVAPNFKISDKAIYLSNKIYLILAPIC